MIYKHELPLIEVEEIKPYKSQWEMQLYSKVTAPGKETAYEPRVTPRENEVKHIEWF